MKSLFTLVVSITAYSLMVAQSFAQVTVFNQPILLPDSGDFGSFSSREVLVAFDTGQALSFDNFVLPGTGTFDLDSIMWNGIYDEPFPAVPLETDFEITIYEDNAANPGTPGAPVHTFNLQAGVAGVSDENVVTTTLSHTSPTTSTTPGGGQAFSYSAPLAGVESLVGGDTYWLSIQAVQQFDTVGDNDPIWQWHLGTGANNDGFFLADALNDPTNSPPYGFLQSDKDLSFSLNVVPEPNSMVMALFGFCSLGLIRRRR